MALIDKLSNAERLGAEISVLAQRAAAGDVRSDPPTDAEILAAYDAGVPYAHHETARLAVARIVRTEPRSPKQVGADAINVVKSIHQTIESGIDFLAGGGKALPPARGARSTASSAKKSTRDPDIKVSGSRR